MSFDLDAAREFSLEVWRYKQGEMVAAMIHLGDRLGLYRAVYTQGPATSELLAEATGLNERWLREWLQGQAAASLIDRDEGGVYSMSDEQAAVLVDENSLLFATASFGGGLTRDDFERMAHSMQTGIGFTYGELGLEAARQIDRSSAPWLRDYLPSVVMPMLGDVDSKLREGGRVLEIGCGGGVAIEGLASRYPATSFVGVDSSGPAIEIARERFADAPNVEFRLVGGDAVADDHPFDFAMTLDCLHDMARPDLAAESVHRLLADDGAWLIKDIKCGPTYESNLRNPMLALMYGYSVSSCLASGTVTEDGLGLGTLGLDPETLEEMVRGAGFTRFERLETEDPVHYYYRVDK